jgi:hypothetical protein
MIRYCSGRAPLWSLPLVWLLVALLSLRFWGLGIEVMGVVDGRQRSLAGKELFGVLGLCASAWCLAPRMQSWELSGSTRPRRWSGVFAAVALVLSAVVNIGVVHLLPHCPGFLVPVERGGLLQPGDYWVADAVVPTITRLSLANTLVVGGVFLGAIAAFGRVIGSFLGLAAYWWLLYASAVPSLCSHNPYGRCLQEVGLDRTPSAATWAGAAAAVVAAVALWSVTGGAEQRTLRSLQSLLPRLRRRGP